MSPQGTGTSSEARFQFPSCVLKARSRKSDAPVLAAAIASGYHFIFATRLVLTWKIGSFKAYRIVTTEQDSESVSL
jgi:hypothetical protein